MQSCANDIVERRVKPTRAAAVKKNKKKTKKKQSDSQVAVHAAAINVMRYLIQESPME